MTWWRRNATLTWMLPLVAGAVWSLTAWLREGRNPVEDLAPAQAAAPDARLLELDGHPVAFRELGRGDPPIIMLHCFAGRMDSWHPVQRHLAESARTIAFDLWGFGASGRPPSLRPGDWTRQVFGLMDRLGMEHAVLAGHSMGGRVALACAAQMPERVRGLVLIGADGLRLPQGYPQLWALAHSPLLTVVQALLMHHPEIIIQMMRGSYPADFPINTALIRRYQHPLRVRGTAEAIRHLGSTYHGEELARLSRQIGRITCPALLLWGAQDRVTPVRDALQLINALPDAELIILPRTHHLPHEERPDVVAEHIERFIRKACGEMTGDKG